MDNGVFTVCVFKCLLRFWQFADLGFENCPKFKKQIFVNFLFNYTTGKHVP